MNIDAFAKKLGADESAVARDEAKLSDDEFKAALRQGRDGPDQRMAVNSPLATGMDFFSPSNAGAPPSLGAQPSAPVQPPIASDSPSTEEMMRASGVPVRSMADAGGLYSPRAQQGAEGAGYQPPAPGIATGRFLGAHDPAALPPPSRDPASSVSPISTSVNGLAPSSPIAQPTYHPAGWDSGRDPLRAGTRNQQAADLGAELKADESYNKAVQQQNTIHADDLEGAYEAAERSRLDRQLAESDRQQYIQARQAKVDKLIDEAANGKVDTGRLWRNGDAGTKIGIVLGGFFGNLIPGVRQVMTAIGASVSDDIQEQRDALERKSHGAEQARGMLGELRQNFGDLRTAELVDEKAKWTNVQTLIDAHASRAQNPIQQAQADKLRVAVGEKLTALQAQIDTVTHVNAFTSGAAAPNGKGFVVKLPDGRQVLAPNEQKFNELTAKSAQVSNIQSNINKALALRKSANPLELANPLSSVHRQLASLQAETAQLVTVARGQGAMSKGDQDVANDAIGNMTGFLGNNDEVLRSTSGRFGEQLSRDADALGAEHVQTGYAVGADGRLTRDVSLVGQADKPRPNMPKGKPVR